MLPHLTRQYSVQELSLLRFGFTTLFCVACAAKSEDPPASATGGSSSNTAKGGATFTSGGTSPGNGGSTFLTGGQVIGQGGSLGNGGNLGSSGASGTATANGGSTPTGAGGVIAAGGTPTAAGGTVVVGNGGTITGAGGTTPPAGGSGGAVSACGTYAGAAKAESKIFVDGFGTSGTWKGYAYTYTYGTATIIPGKSTTVSCFTGKALCAQGTIPATFAAGAGIGWNVNQAQGATITETAVVAGTLRIQLTGAVAGMRVGLGPPTGEEFCYTLTAADVAMANAGLFSIPVANFKQYCYAAATDLMPPIPYAAQPVKSIQVSVPGDMAAAKTFDFCIVDVQSP